MRCSEACVGMRWSMRLSMRLSVCECLSGLNGLNTRRESEECGDTKTRQKKKKKKSAYEFHGNVQEKIVRLGRAIFFLLAFCAGEISFSLPLASFFLSFLIHRRSPCLHFFPLSVLTLSHIGHTPPPPSPPTYRPSFS